jgi:hypothetical protein
MDEPERLHRPELPRDRPIRDFMSYVRGPASEQRASNGGASVIDDAVSEGVKLGYSVIDEQIKQGERLAERLRPGGRRDGGAPPDLSGLIERALNIYKDFGALALAAAETLARNPSVQSGLHRAFRGDRDPATTTSSRSSHVGPIAIEINSSRRVTVKLEKQPFPEGFSAHVHELRAIAASVPPLKTVGFTTDADTSAPVLRIHVDDAQPAGVYSGIVVDAVSNEPWGAISIRIHG